MKLWMPWSKKGMLGMVEPEYACEYCPRKFPTERGRNIHVGRVHEAADLKEDERLEIGNAYEDENIEDDGDEMDLDDEDNFSDYGNSAVTERARKKNQKNLIMFREFERRVEKPCRSKARAKKPHLSKTQRTGLTLFTSFCEQYRNKLPAKLLATEQPRVVELADADFGESLPARIGGLIRYLQLQIYFRNRKFAAIPPETIAAAVECSPEGLIACYQELLDRYGVDVLYSEDTVTLDVERLLGWLGITEADPRYDEERVGFLDALINSFYLQFKVHVDSYEPAFLQWVYQLPFWETAYAPEVPFWYFFAYVYDQRNGWPMEELFDMYLRRKGIAGTAPQSETRRIRMEVSQKFGKQGQLERIVSQVLAQHKVRTPSEYYLRLLQKYCNGLAVDIPPWLERDAGFYELEHDTFADILDEMERQQFTYLAPDLEWVQVQGEETWVRTYTDNLAVQVFYAHSKWLEGLPQAAAEWRLVCRQFPDDWVTDPAHINWAHLGITKGPDQMEYCLKFIRDHVQVLIFSEYQGNIGRGVYAEVEQARAKGIPIFLLRSGLFWLNPRLQVYDATDWALKYAKVLETPYEPVRNISEVLEF